MAGQYDIHVSGSAAALWPACTFFALLWTGDGEALEVPKRYPFCGRWGEILSTHLLLRDAWPMPRRLDMVWLSVVERRFYGLVADLPSDDMERLWQQSDPASGEPLFSHIVVGMAPYGQVAVWLRGLKKSVRVAWLRGEPAQVPMAEFLPINPAMTLDEYCDTYINGDEGVRENLRVNGLPEQGLFDRMMTQYCYRVVPLFERWMPDDDKRQWHPHEADERGVPGEAAVEVSRFDGTHDYTRDGSLLLHHTAGRPEWLSVSWRAGKQQWTAYFMLDERATAATFERFYGAHRDTRADLIVHADPAARHYELALYRYGLSQPLVLPERCFKLIVFKDGFEHHRSASYDLPRGAWRRV